MWSRVHVWEKRFSVTPNLPDEEGRGWECWWAETPQHLPRVWPWSTLGCLPHTQTHPPVAASLHGIYSATTSSQKSAKMPAKNRYSWPNAPNIFDSSLMVEEVGFQKWGSTGRGAVRRLVTNDVRIALAAGLALNQPQKCWLPPHVLQSIKFRGSPIPQGNNKVLFSDRTCQGKHPLFFQSTPTVSSRMALAFVRKAVIGWLPKHGRPTTSSARSVCIDKLRQRLHVSPSLVSYRGIMLILYRIFSFEICTPYRCAMSRVFFLNYIPK